MLDEPALEATATVANNQMNRERRLLGPGGYERELGLDIVGLLARSPGRARWLDLACGTGRALLDAEALLPDAELVGVDLVDFFWPAPPGSRVQRTVTPLRSFAPEGSFDLVTCVHGLHYVGDKLGTLLRMRSWLRPGGQLAAHLDLDTVRIDGQRAQPALLRSLGLRWSGRRHLVTAIGPGAPAPAPRFAGAACEGVTWTGQPGVVSHYER